MPKKIVLFDSDGLIYAAAFAAQASVGEGNTPSTGLAIQCLRNYISTHVNQINKHFFTAAQIREGIDYDIRHYLSCNDGSNFRIKAAKTVEYKVSRKNMERPVAYEALRDYMLEHLDATLVKGMEAEDMVAYQAQKLGHEKTVICSMDKDMLQVPGWHMMICKIAEYQRRAFYVSQLGTMQLERMGGGNIHLFATGEYMLAFQMLHGDSTDDIPPLAKGYGPKKAYDLLHGSSSPMFVAEAEYMKVLGDGYRERFDETHALVYLLRNNADFKKWGIKL